jgi:regulator of replication initiation timing
MENEMTQDSKSVSADELQKEILELKKIIDSLELENSNLKAENKKLKDKKPYDGGVRID